MQQLDAQLEGLAIGLEQRGEKSAAHCIRLTVAEIASLRAEVERLEKYVADVDVLMADEMKRLRAEVGRLEREVNELKRTRPEAEAVARVAGYREGQADAKRDFRALIGNEARAALAGKA